MSLKVFSNFRQCPSHNNLSKKIKYGGNLRKLRAISIPGHILGIIRGLVERSEMEIRAMLQCELLRGLSRVKRIEKLWQFDYTGPLNVSLPASSNKYRRSRFMPLSIFPIRTDFRPVVVSEIVIWLTVLLFGGFIRTNHLVDVWKCRMGKWVIKMF